MRKKRLLFVDDDSDYLAVRKRLIEELGGYIVYIAATLEAARDLLRTRYVHLGTFDVYMADNDSSRRISGLTLVHDPAYEDLVKLVVTGKPADAEDVREALKPIPGRRLPPAVDYQYKDEDWHELVGKIETAIAKYCLINWDLEIIWPRFAFSDGLVAALNPAVPQDVWHDRPDELREHSDELTDLLAMAFYDYDRIEVKRPIIWQDSARLALPVLARRGEEMYDRVIILGQKDIVTRIVATRRRLMPQYPPAGHAQALSVARPLHTLHYAAELLELPGALLAEAKTLTDYYTQAKTIQQVRACFDYLLNTSLRPLNPRTRITSAEEDADRLLRAHAGLSDDSPTALRAAIQRVDLAASGAGQATLRLAHGWLTIRQLDAPGCDLPDPADFLSQPGPFEFARPLRVGLSCGAPSPNTILVDQAGPLFWLTDYGQLGDGPLLSSLAALEVSVKFDLHRFTTLAQFQDAEMELLEAEELTTPLSTTGDYKNPYAAIERIRRAAQKYGDLPAYRRALFYHATRRLLDMPDEELHSKPVTGLCLCLGLAMLAEQLSRPATSRPAPGEKGLIIDEPSQSVWLNDRRISLPPRSYRFLLYLWKHPRKCCSIAEILTASNKKDYGRENAHTIVNEIRNAFGIGRAARDYLANCDDGYILHPNGQPDVPPSI